MTSLFVFSLIALAALPMAGNRVRDDLVTLVVDPGRYRFLDFVKVGTPLLVLTYVVVLVVVPLVFPF